MMLLCRALGAKVGKRVFWPGSGLLGVVEFDLLNIGDDVVFGSRRCEAYCGAGVHQPVGIKLCMSGGGCLLAGCTAARVLQQHVLDNSAQPGLC